MSSTAVLTGLLSFFWADFLLLFDTRILTYGSSRVWGLSPSPLKELQSRRILRTNCQSRNYTSWKFLLQHSSIGWLGMQRSFYDQLRVSIAVLSFEAVLFIIEENSFRKIRINCCSITQFACILPCSWSSVASPNAKFSTMKRKTMPNVEQVEESTYSGLLQHFKQEQRYFQLKGAYNIRSNRFELLYCVQNYLQCGSIRSTVISSWSPIAESLFLTPTEKWIYFEYTRKVRGFSF